MVDGNDNLILLNLLTNPRIPGILSFQFSRLTPPCPQTSLIFDPSKLGCHFGFLLGGKIVGEVKLFRSSSAFNPVMCLAIVLQQRSSNPGMLR